MDSLHEANSEYVSKDEESGDDTSSRNLRVNVDTGDSTFEVVEKTNWNEGTWSDTKSTRYTLTVNGSDVAGILRFMGPPPNGSKDSEFFLVAVGNDTAVKADEDAAKQDHQTTATGLLNSGTTITVTINEKNVVTVT
jgi:hypothetical protein